jgi:NAD(P) transhydrogenase
MTRHFDLLVIGGGPGGQRAAIQAAKLGKKVALAEKSDQLGGAALRAGTVPTKALREAALVLTGLDNSGLIEGRGSVRRDVTLNELRTIAREIVGSQLRVVEDSLARNRIEVLWGCATFQDERTVVIDGRDGSTIVTADYFVVATGTHAARPDHVPFNERNIFTMDTLIDLSELPRSILIVGGGVIGVEMACIMAALGIPVTLIEGRGELLPFLDGEIIDAFQTAIRRIGVTLRLGEKVQQIEEIERSNGVKAVRATLESGKQLHGDALLYAVGRQGNCVTLGLDAVGICFDDRERLKVNDHFQTPIPHIYAVGDVIGFPALAATAMEQGRLAACHAFGEPTPQMKDLIPIGIYSIPEISMVGQTEIQLTAAAIPYETGVALYSELARGELLGDRDGILKLLVHQRDRRILGVHCIGTSATELVHIGQMVMAFKGTVDDLVANVFNYPTLAEAYKVAAYNAVNKLEFR